jgi:hypothetical protein
MGRIALVVMFMSGLAAHAAAQPATSSAVEAKNECLETSDPRGAVVVRGRATSSSPLASLSLSGSVSVTCAPPPPDPGSIVSAPPVAVKKSATLVTKKVAGNGSQTSLSVARTLDLRTYANMCAVDGNPPFQSMSVRWTVSATDGAGATDTTSGGFDAACGDGTSSCLSKPVAKRVTCGSDRCACGLRCCPYVADPDSRCVSHALCERLRRQQERRDR